MALVVLLVVAAVGGGPRATTIDREVARIQTHLAIVDGELRAADIRALSPEQRARRADLIEELARYRLRGVFPRNLDFAERTPYFIDDRGVRCAMAHLIETHGGAALVQRVAATANNAYIRELAGDAELLAWLETNGLTVAEAARIQPAYSSGIGEKCADGLYGCHDSVCEPTLDEPTLSFCSPPCDPNAPVCPVGVENIQMECQLRGDQYLCVYPEPSPGTLGWPCTWESDSCPFTWGCVGDDPEDQSGICTPPCSDDRACPDGFECEAKYCPADCLRRCFPKKDEGCSAARHPPVYGFWLAVLLLARRRARRNATRA